ncbi:MAG: histidine phosphatase family protein [Acidobacteria bacterium]|nr:histidine phosphatase family protein [Acidobacteriota bacterium]
MGKLILVRHGESLANRQRTFAEDDTPLTELGRQQAAEVAGRIGARFRPAALVSSPLTRARQTAEIIGDELGLDVEVVRGLEECDFGFLKGQTYEFYFRLIETDPTYDKHAPWLWVPKDGESGVATADRAVAALQRLAAGYPDKEILVVCHGMMMVSIAARLTGNWKGMDVPPNCAVLTMEHEDGRLEPPVLAEDCLVPQE